MKAHTHMYKPLALAVALAVNTAAAQEADADEGMQLERIEVTAQKRTQGLQETPISVSAMGGEKLAEAAIPAMQDFSVYVPNFNVTPNAIGDVISIRGIQSGILASIEQSVGTFVDGVYRGRGNQSRFSFLDVGMVEVLRGPQSTLFGKNTIGGALNITSAKPTEDFEAMVSALYEFEHEETELQGYISGPLSETLRGRFAFMSRSIDDGWIYNEYYDQGEPMTDEWAARASLEWDASENLTVSFKYEHGDWDNDGQPFEEFQVSDGLAFTYGLFGVPGATEVNNGVTSIGNNSDGMDYGSAQHFVGDSDELAIRADYSLENGTLTAIYGHSAYVFDRDLDADFNAYDAIGFEEEEDFTQDSLEVRYVSDLGNGFEYIVGAYWQSADLYVNAKTNFNVRATDPDSLAGPAGLVAFSELAPLGALPDMDGDGQLTPTDGILFVGTIDQFTRAAQLDQTTDSWAVFGQGNFELSEDWNLTVGLRYGEEDKDATQGVQCAEWDSLVTKDPTTCPVLGFVLGEFTPHVNDLNREEEDWNYNVNLQYDVSRDTMVYVSASNGTKGGGFNSFSLTASPDEAEFEEETVVSYEFGAKMTLLDGSAELNFAAFTMDYEDLQAAIFTGATGFKVENAANASVSGIELDGRWRLTENLMLRGSLGFVDFSFDEYPNAGCTDAQKASLNDGVFGWGTFIKPAPGTTGAGGVIAVDLDGDGATDSCEQDLAGGTNAYTPEWSGALSLEHETDINDDFFLRTVLDVNYLDDHHTAQDNDPIPFQDAYALVNLTITLAQSDGEWDVSFVGRNLTDEDYIVYTNDMPLFAGSQQAGWGRGANYALRARLRFY